MRIERITLNNWMCYRGETVIHLDEKSYAILAQYASDPGRSNYSGKSALVGAIPFALFGDHRFDTEDAWITKGEESGSVHILFSDGMNVKRSRTRGKRTEIGCYDTKTNVKSVQGEAEVAIQRWLGVDAEMFKATAYVEQKQMAKLILAKPKDRMEMVSAWLNLEKLQECEATARRIATKYSTEADAIALTLTRESNDHEERSVRLQKFNEEGGMAGLREAAEILEERLKEQDALAITATKHNVENGRAIRAYEAARDGHTVVWNTLLSMPEVDSEAMREGEMELDVIKIRLSDLDASIRQTKALACGAFDGACPVSPGFPCPAKDALNARSREANAELTALRAEHAGKSVERDDVMDELRQAKEIIARRQTAEHALAQYSTVMDTEKDAYDRALLAGLVEVPGDRDALRAEWGAAQGELRAMADLAKQVEAGRKKIADLTQEFASASKQAGAYQQAAMIFGRSGAQRRIAEAALGEIEGTANQLLRDAGIDLSVQVRWAREGDGLASSCDKCGAAYPTSAKVKECPKCAAPRGQNLVNKMEIILSDRSGAAEDLAGVAIQLAASQWLRRERGSQVEFAVLDEPFGALDRTNRKALSTALPKMLAAAGIHQAFVIAHTADVLDALPARIQILSKDGCATASVEG